MFVIEQIFVLMDIFSTFNYPKVLEMRFEHFIYFFLYKFILLAFDLVANYFDVSQNCFNTLLCLCQMFKFFGCPFWKYILFFVIPSQFRSYVVILESTNFTNMRSIKMVFGRNPVFGIRL